MTVYVVIQEDRREDISVHVFSDAGMAIGWAQERARESSRSGEVDEHRDGEMIGRGWLYYGEYSSEGDNIRVEAKVVDEA